MKAWKIILKNGEVYFEDWSESKEEAEKAAALQFGEQLDRVEEY